MREIAQLHIRALPKTWTSKRGETLVGFLYSIVEKVGYVKTIKRGAKIVGVVSGIGKWILTLVVDPKWQRKGIGREMIEGLTGERYVYTEKHNIVFYEKLNFKQLLRLQHLVILWRK